MKLNHISISIMVNSKQTWNMFLDKIEHGLYPYMIIIMTSNKSSKNYVTQQIIHI